MSDTNSIESYINKNKDNIYSTVYKYNITIENLKQSTKFTDVDLVFYYVNE